MSPGALPLQPVEGVYLGMPDHEYHAVDALGASDFATLAVDPASWWYGSRHNRDRRVRRDRPHLSFGHALHALVLEGEEAYAQRFAIEPDEEDEGYARNIWEIKNLLAERGVATRGIMDPQDIHALAREHGLTRKVWTLAVCEYKRARKSGQRILKASDDVRIRRMAQLLLEHPDLGAALRSGLSEVSVFWRRPEEPDVLLRARFDRLLPTFIIDLKTMSNPRGLAPRKAALNAIAEQEYDLAVPHYAEARKRLCDFVREGRVYGWDGAQPLAEDWRWLKQVKADAEWRWVWIFIQVMSNDAGSERAPVVAPIHTAPEGQWFKDARSTIARALANYRQFRDRFGLETGWSVVEPILQMTAEPIDRIARQRRDS